MKKKTILIIVGLALVFSIGTGIRSYAAIHQLPAWLVAKQQARADHDKQMEEAKSKPWNPQPNQQIISQDSPGSSKRGIFSRSEAPVLPIPGELQEGLNVTNVAFTQYDILIAGSVKSDPTHGFLYVIHTDKKTIQSTRTSLDFKGDGAITITSIQGNTVGFKSANGKDGLYHLDTQQYVLH